MSIYTSEGLTEKVSQAAKVIAPIPNLVETLKTSMSVSDQVAAMASESNYDNEVLCVEYIWRRLAALGVYPDAESHEILMSADCTEKDARRSFCENGEPNLPPARFKRVWAILREQNARKADEDLLVSEGEPTTDSAFVELHKGLNKLAESIADKPVGQWKDKELIQAYGTDCDPEVERVLRERSGGRAFIVFSDEDTATVDVETTLRFLREARRRETPVNYKVGDCLKRLYAVGEFPNVVQIESPFHPGVILFDGYCDKSKVSWAGVNYKCMQLARLAKETGEVVSKPDQLQFILNVHKDDGDVSDLMDMYPEAALLFKELESTDSLPNLKMKMSGSPKKSADPFHTRY